MTLMETLTTLAMAAPREGAKPAGIEQMLVPMVLIFGIFYFMLIRPQQRKDKERRAMIEQAKSGDRILFSGGILGTITNVKDHTFVVKIADNVKIEIARGAVSKVLEKDEKAVAEDEKR